VKFGLHHTPFHGSTGDHTQPPCGYQIAQFAAESRERRKRPASKRANQVPQLPVSSQLVHSYVRQAEGMSAQRLLLVDDDDNLRVMLEAALRHSGFCVITANNGRDALRLGVDEQLDLIVLDVMLPDIDGFEVCRRLRQDATHTPIVFLTARDTTDDKVKGLTIGGDDYLVKPFSLEELVARIRVVLRRHGVSEQSELLECGDIIVDDAAHRVTKDGVDVQLSPTEYRLLHVLMVNQGRVLSKAQLLDHVWQYDFGGDGGVVETYIGYLRRKVDNGEARMIRTVRGFGYSISSAR
jgi:two-component system, OmpR family, response regulator